MSIITPMMLQASGAQSISPDEISNLRAWFEADDGPLTSSGKIYQWDDLSDNSHTLVNTVSNLRPALQTNQLNGLPIANFINDASYKQMWFDTPFAASGEDHTFVVIKSLSAYGSGYESIIGRTGTGPHYYLYDGAPTVYFSGDRQVEWASSIDDAWHIVEFGFNSSRVFVNVDNGTELSQDIETVDSTWSHFMVYNTGALYWMIGSVYGLVQYSSIISGSDRLGLLTYLSNKTAISIS